MKIRQSNIELLRIIAIYTIIIHHITLHSGFMFSSGFDFQKYIIQLLQIGGKIGVDIFVIISGYFLITSSGKVLKKTIQLWTTILFYSLLFLVVSYVVSGNEVLTINNILYSVFPVLSRHYWFMSTYIVLFVFHSYINSFISGLDRGCYRRLLVLTTLMWIIIPTLTNKSFESNELIFFVLLYLFGAYIRQYGVQKYSQKQIIVVNMIFLLLTYLSVAVIDIFEIYIPQLNKYETYFYGMQKLNIVVLSITFFLIFRNLNLKNNTLINSWGAKPLAFT